MKSLIRKENITENIAENIAAVSNSESNEVSNSENTKKCHNRRYWINQLDSIRIRILVLEGRSREYIASLHGVTRGRISQIDSVNLILK